MAHFDKTDFQIAMEKKQNRKKRARWGVALPFMRGSVHFFLLCILSSMLASLCELVIPRIIGFTVDSLLGGKELPPYAAKIAGVLGGESWLRGHLWSSRS